jgi:localization factor PodJL
MNKAVPWNINGVGFDAREAAREAARRQGKSLGEWLDGVIAEHAAEYGLEMDHVDGQARIDAVKAKLERLGARARYGAGERGADSDDQRPARRNRLATNQFDSRGRGRFDAGGEAADREDIGMMPRNRRADPRGRDSYAGGYAREDRQPQRSRVAPDDTEFLLEEAIEAMERRATLAERKGEKALASIAKIIEATENKREDEHEMFMALSRKLSEMEARIANRVSGDHYRPIKGALTRLEARLDAFGRRSQREAQTAPGDEGAAFATPSRSQADELPPARLRLGEAIADITHHQRLLDEETERWPDAAPRQTPPRQARAREPDAASLKAAQPRAAGQNSDEIRRLQRGMADLEAKLADMHQSIANRQREEPPQPMALAPLPGQIDQNAAAPAGIASAGPAQPKVSGPAGLASLAAEIANLSGLLGQLGPDERASAIDETIATLLTRAGKFGDLASLEVLLRPAQKPSSLAQPGGSRPEPPAKGVRTLLQKPQEPAFLDKIERRFEDLGSKIDQMQRQLVSGAERTLEWQTGDAQSLEALVRGLSGRIEAARAPDASHRAIEALQQQIAQLSERFEQSDSELAALPAIERSMQALFAHIEETRRSIETAAAKAAQEAAAAALAAGEQARPAVAPDIAALISLQEQADRRARATHDALHETLEKVVDRLSHMESEIAQARAPQPQATPAPPAAAEVRRGLDSSSGSQAPRVRDQRASSPRAQALPDLLLDASDLLDAPVRPARSTKRVKTPSQQAEPADMDESAGRADFIAAARRAARTAQNDPTVIALKQMGTSVPGSASRADLMAKTRDYVETHKKPILMSIAALFVMVGTLAVIGAMKGEDGARTFAAGKAVAPVKIAQAVPRTETAAPRTEVATRAATPVASGAGRVIASDLTPNTLPKAPPPPGAALAGSDTTPTGSLVTIPSFAAMKPARSAAESTGVLKQWADSGNAAAEYEMASRYAEGRLITKDFALAANLFEKAARQGLVPAQYKLASLYEKGIGVPRDSAKARTWYAKAAEAGNPRAMHNLAVMIADGDGKPDYAGAVEWFRKAAEYGVHDSQYNLAILYARGLGVKQSLIQSYQWFAVAAEQSDVDAAKKRDEVAVKLSPDDLAIAKALAAAFHPKTADVAATEVEAPAGGWDSLTPPTPLKSERPKLSSL